MSGHPLLGGRSARKDASRGILAETLVIATQTATFVWFHALCIHTQGPEFGSWPGGNLLRKTDSNIELVR